MHMLTEDESLAVTAMSGVNDTRNHLQRLLNHTRLRGIAWINHPHDSVSTPMILSPPIILSHPNRRAHFLGEMQRIAIWPFQGLS
jgi:hypothetical protein